MKLDYITIIDAIQYAVDKICKQEYKNDTDSPPKFTVSVADRINKHGKIDQHEIVLTIEHNGIRKTRTIFPRLEYNYGYESLKDEMTWLYNSTM